LQLTNAGPPSNVEQTVLRPPTPDDAPELWRLARDSGGLDLNSPYAYVLAGHHFAGTSIVAETAEGLAGFVYAYPPPSEPGTVFVWQVTVAADHRGRGLARQMLHAVIARARRLGSTRLTATVTPSNDASRRLFTAVAHDVGATYDEQPWIPADHFPAEAGGGIEHEPEQLIAIEPIGPILDASPSNPERQHPEGTP
jgi:L-2,4-diaminobutyric acid acetyltransferase